MPDGGFRRSLPRRIFHVLGGLLIVFLFQTLDRSVAVKACLVALAFFGGLDLLRLVYPKLNSFIVRFYGPFMRDHEKSGRQLSGQFAFLLGASFCVCVLPRDVATYSLLILVCMDPVAGMVGSLYGRTRWTAVASRVFVNHRELGWELGPKTVEGSLAGFVVALLVGILFWMGWVSVAPASFAWSAAFFGAVVATVAESWPSQWDDNLRIPLWTGIGLWAFGYAKAMPLSY